MADNFKEYLAARILSEGKPVTYRLLSRALKVNVNIAKQMLYEFYTKQNAKKPQSVHATYFLTGRKRTHEHTNGVNGSARDGDDTVMHSSPFMSSMPEPEEPAEEPVQTTTIVLVREKELDGTKAEFEAVTSIHIYSLEPGPIENLNFLSVCNNEIATEQAKDDPLERWRLYGSIHNPYIKRRTTKYTPPAAATAPKLAPKVAIKPSATATTKEKEKAVSSEDKSSDRSTPQASTAPGTLKKQDSKPNLKREKSDIFKSFAKAKPKKETEKSNESTPAPAEDEMMQGMSEDEGDADDTPDIQFDEAKAAEAKKARAEREEKLRKMMEESDDEMEDVSPAEEMESQEAAPPPKEPSPEPGSEAAVTSQGGRRRGRRKVMKKIRGKDEDGYMVTKEEAVWESFSEDEPEPKRPKPAPKPSTAKPKPGGKKGQGSIANFFKKA